MQFPWKRSWPDLNEDLPVDVYPCSNGEFVPPPPTGEQRAIMRLADEETERVRRRLGMSRREFVRTSAAFTVGFWAINQVGGTRFGRYAVASHDKTTAACDLEWPGAQLDNLPGEFIFDVQSHHVESDGIWRVTNPGFHAFFAAIWSQSGPLGGVPGIREDNSVRGFGYGREIDPIENLSRYHYLKELFLDSATTMTVLSAVPSSPDLTQPLPIRNAAETVHTVNRLAGSQRCVMHAFVMPNRGSAGTTAAFAGQDPLYMQEEFDLMERRAHLYRDILRGWKVYPSWGDIPYTSGWYHDDDVGLAFLEKVLEVSAATGTPPVVATHKGFALPAFDQRAASPRDIGPAARQYPGVRFVVYHSGYDGESMGPYPGDNAINDSDRRVDALIKSLRVNGWDASRFIPPGLEHGNSPNVWAEIGSTWRSVMGNANAATHLLGKLIEHVGPRRICWGTDSLWFGSPHREIVALRNLTFSEEARALYNLPYGLDGDRFDPRRNALDGSSYLSAHPDVADWPTDGVAHPERTIRNGIFGRNAADAYEIDPDLARFAIDCDDVQKIRDGYVINPATPRENTPMRSNMLFGPRTPRELHTMRSSQPWGP